MNNEKKKNIIKINIKKNFLFGLNIVWQNGLSIIKTFYNNYKKK